MTRVIVSGFSLSIDGFGAGPEQSLEDPLGKGGEELHTWMLGTRFFKQMIGADGGSEGIDNDYAVRSMSGFGAFILGRNMFGPIRDEWPDQACSAIPSPNRLPPKPLSMSFWPSRKIFKRDRRVMALFNSK